jgi:rhodanese-related sulfurtransferase
MPGIPFVEVEQLRDMIQSPAPPLIIDVREKWENDLCSLPDSRLIPLGDLPQRLGEVPKDRAVVMLCHHGNRSGHATAFLQRQGYTQVFNLKGGIDAWSQRIDPTVKTYT